MLETEENYLHQKIFIHCSLLPSLAWTSYRSGEKLGVSENAEFRHPKITKRLLFENHNGWHNPPQIKGWHCCWYWSWKLGIWVFIPLIAYLLKHNFEPCTSDLFNHVFKLFESFQNLVPPFSLLKKSTGQYRNAHKVCQWKSGGFEILSI